MKEEGIRHKVGEQREGVKKSVRMGFLALFTIFCFYLIIKINFKKLDGKLALTPTPFINFLNYFLTPTSTNKATKTFGSI